MSSSWGKDYPDVPVGHPDDPHPLLIHLRTGSWLDGQTFDPLSWIVPGLVPEGMSLVVGGPKIGKSWLSLDIGLGVAAGGRVLGKVAVTEPRPVLLLALEDGDRRLQDRCRMLMAGQPIPELFHYMTRIEPGQVVGTVEAWLDQYAPESKPLVILDTLGKVMPPMANGESQYQRDYRVTGRLKRIADDRPGMALVGLHHDRKAHAEDFVDGVSGTNGIAGAVDTLVVIARPRTEARGLFKVTGRDVIEREYAVQVTPDCGWQLVGDSLDAAADNAQTVRATVNLGDRSADIVQFVARHPKGVRAADVAAAMDMTSEQATVYLTRLHDADRLHRPKRGLYLPVISVRSVISNDPDGPNTTHITHITGGVGDPGGRPDCIVCGKPLAPTLVEAGASAHPGCVDPERDAS